MSNVLVTGSGGALGKFVVAELERQGYITYKVFHSSSEEIKDTSFYGDLKSKVFIRKVFNGPSFDFIIHCAGVWNGFNSDMSIAYDNSVMMMNLLDAANVKKFIFVSSSAADYMGNGYPSSTYGHAKLFSEELLKVASKDGRFRYTIWRPFHIISPEEKYCPGSSHICTNLYYKHFVLGEDIDLESMPTKRNISFIWVEDVAQCIVNFMQRSDSDGEIFNLGTPDLRSPYDVACQMLALLKYREYRNRNSNDCRFSKMDEVFSWRPKTDFYECIRKFIQYKRKKT